MVDQEPATSRSSPLRRRGSGRFDEALKSARMIDAETIPGQLAEDRKSEFLDEQRFRKAETLADISLEQAKAGDRAGARRTAEEAARIVRSDRERSADKYPIIGRRPRPSR